MDTIVRKHCNQTDYYETPMPQQSGRTPECGSIIELYGMQEFLYNEDKKNILAPVCLGTFKVLRCFPYCVMCVKVTGYDDSRLCETYEMRTDGAYIESGFQKKLFKAGLLNFIEMDRYEIPDIPINTTRPGEQATPH